MTTQLNPDPRSTDLGPDVNCRGLPGDKFFIQDHELHHAGLDRLQDTARHFCASCLVRPACATIGGLPRNRYGLWGGVLYRGTHTAIDLLGADQ